MSELGEPASAAAVLAAGQVADVRDRPQARLELLRSTYAPLPAPPLHLRYRRAALAFMGWQVRRGLLNPPDHERPGSPWWRAVNEGLLRDTCEARLRLLGHPGPGRHRRRAVGAVRREPSARVVPGPQRHDRERVPRPRRPGGQENRVERFFLNLVLSVCSTRMPSSRPPGSPCPGSPRQHGGSAILESDDRHVPVGVAGAARRYPLEGELEDYIASEHTVGRLLDLG